MFLLGMDLFYTSISAQLRETLFNTSCCGYVAAFLLAEVVVIYELW